MFSCGRWGSRVLEPWKVKAILTRWLEYETLSRGMSSIEVLGVPSEPQAGLSDAFLFQLTVGCKVEKCPRISGVLGHAFRFPVPAVEVAARYRMDVTALDAAEKATGTPNPEANRSRVFLGSVEATDEYAEGMRFLGKSLETASLLDSDYAFLAYVCAAIKEHGANAEYLHELMRLSELTSSDVAEILGVRADTVRAWTCHKEPVPEYRISELERYLNDIRDCWLLFDELRGKPHNTRGGLPIGAVI